MPRILAYTKRGDPAYSDVLDSMHLALERDGRFVPLRNDTGVLFPQASYDEGDDRGTSKTLRDPWLFRRAGGFGVAAVRRNEAAPDSRRAGCILIFLSADLVRYEEAAFVPVSDREVAHPHCVWEEERQAFYLEWETERGWFCGYTRAWEAPERIVPCTPRFAAAKADFKDAEPGNALELTTSEAERVERYLGTISHVDTLPIAATIRLGEPAPRPKAVCVYSDGSTHEKAVEWDEAALARAVSSAGVFRIRGRISQTHYPFPYLAERISDPCLVYLNGRYFLSGSGARSVVFRIADSIEGLRRAKPIEIYRLPASDKEGDNLWAPELHVIRGVPYVFTTVGKRQWYTVRAHVLRCVGDPANPADWEAPRLVVRPDGTELNPRGISLDMTYFEDAGRHYVMWSNRVMHASRGEPAEIDIATVDPSAPWQLTSEPVRVVRPLYGWDRLQTEVDEGPFLLRRGEELFVTVSGSSTEYADLYCVGLLRAQSGADLLSPEAWDWLPYPILTKESVKGEFGPGHNSFVKDPETGDDLLVYHAVPHDAAGKSLGRRMGIRRVHWGKRGYPDLEMTEERDLDPARREVTMTLTVKAEENAAAERNG